MFKEYTVGVNFHQMSRADCIVFVTRRGGDAPLAAKASIELKVRYPSRILPSSQQQWLSPLLARQQHNRRQHDNNDGDTARTCLGTVAQSQSSEPIRVGFRACVSFCQPVD